MRKLIVAVVAVVALTHCRTREDAARSTGREARFAASASCGTGAGLDVECRSAVCRERCSSQVDGSAYLVAACVEACAEHASCSSDTDCAPNGVCVMVAPRVRRCAIASDAAP